MCSPVRDGEEVAADMLAPATKRLCSSVGTIVKRVAIEGNIAAGKSTFLGMLTEHFPECKVVGEPLAHWQDVSDNEEEITTSQKYGSNLLDIFYKDPARWSYTFQTYACVSRLRAQLRPVPPELDKASRPLLFFERSIYSDRFAFARNCHESGLMSDIEYSVYCDWHSFLSEALPLSFDGIIYLKTSPEVCYQRLKKRARPEEKSVSIDYLESLHAKHEDWLVHGSIDVPPAIKDMQTLVLDCSREFETDEERRGQIMAEVKKFVDEKIFGSKNHSC